MKRVLIVSYYFPPIATSGAMRPLGFCRYLAEYGWIPRVLSTAPESVDPPLGVDESLAARLPGGIRVDRVPHRNAWKSLLRARDRMRQSFGARGHGHSHGNGNGSGPVPAGTRSTRLNPLVRAIKESALEWAFAFPDQHREWLNPAVRCADRIAPWERPDVVFASGGPWTSLLTGYSIAQRWAVPLVCDFRDPWTRNPSRVFPSRWLLRRAQALERRICGASSGVVANTPELRERLAADYPDLADRFVVITNGFDGDGLGDGGPGVPGARADQPQLELCHFGTVYAIRTPFSLLQALVHLAERRRITPDQLRVRFVGRWLVEDERCNAMAAALEARGLLRREPIVPHDRCFQEMRRAQALLILQAAAPLQIPGKIYEYVASGRPLVVVGGEGATAALVRRHGLGQCVADDPGALTDWFERVLDRKTTVQPPRECDRARFHYRTLTGQLVEILDAARRRPVLVN